MTDRDEKMREALEDLDALEALAREAFGGAEARAASMLAKSIAAALSHPAPDVPGADEVGEPKWLLVKRGLYYRPNSHGYTGIKDDAGRFEEAYAQNHCRDTDVTMIREDRAPEYSSACFPDVMADHVQRKFARLQAELDAARAELAEERAKVAGKPMLLDADERTSVSIFTPYDSPTRAQGES
jgi:hypothetical protein